MLLHKQINSINNSYIDFNMDKRPDLESSILNSLSSFMMESKDELNSILNVNNSKYSFEDFYEAINTKSTFKEKQTIMKLDNNFVSSVLDTSAGIIYFEAVDELDTFTAIIETLKSRDALVISRFDEHEYDIINYLLLLVHKVLEAFKLNDSLICSLPYEECEPSLCDVIIEKYYKNKVTFSKPKSDEMIIFVEDGSFIENAKKDFDLFNSKGNNVIYKEGKIEENIDLLLSKRYKSVAVYTTKPDLAYKLINQVHSDNVLINTSLDYTREVYTSDNLFLQTKHIMYQI